MTTARAINAGACRTAAGDDLQRAGEGELAAILADAAAAVRRVLDVLDAVKLLLLALSPPEIEAAASRVLLGRMEGREAMLWQVYRRRHETLSGVFAGQHAACAQLARAFFDRHGLPDRVGREPGDDDLRVQP